MGGVGSPPPGGCHLCGQPRGFTYGSGLAAHLRPSLTRSGTTCWGRPGSPAAVRGWGSAGEGQGCRRVSVACVGCAGLHRGQARAWSGGGVDRSPGRGWWGQRTHRPELWHLEMSLKTSEPQPPHLKNGAANPVPRRAARASSARCRPERIPAPAWAGAGWVWLLLPAGEPWSRAPGGCSSGARGPAEVRGAAREQKGVPGTEVRAGQWHTQGWGAGSGAPAGPCLLGVVLSVLRKAHWLRGPSWGGPVTVR